VERRRDSRETSRQRSGFGRNIGRKSKEGVNRE
jgi:hypothetical protein